MAHDIVRIGVKSRSSLPAQIEVQTSEPLIKRLRIPVIEPIILQHGSSEVSVSIMDAPSPKGEPRFILSEELASEWGLSSGDTLHIQYDSKKRRVRLGPILGILTDQVYSSHSNGLFGPYTSYFREVTLAGRHSSTFVYIFTPGDVDLQNRQVMGWRYHLQKWVRHRFPLPDVVYNRISSRKTELGIEELLNYFEENSNSILFNSRFLDKVEVARLLARHGKGTHLSPETITVFEPKAVAALFKAYSIIFMKPSNGSLGHGIIRFSKATRGWNCLQNTITGRTQRNFPDSRRLLKFIQLRMQRSTYILQRGIALIRVAGAPVDFRALLQKNRLGQWTITSIVARIASNQSFVSNIAQGGSMSRVRGALNRSKLPSSIVPSVEKQLKQTALSIAEALDEASEGHFAELGIDLGVDVSGQVWLIEVNSKPSKTEDAAVEAKIRPSVRKMMHYIHYLFQSRKKETGD
jgi:glutathione synthase/RimK-type ligase-like ATP-grasp enzyme